MKLPKRSCAAGAVGLMLGFSPGPGFAGEIWIAGWSQRCSTAACAAVCIQSRETAAVSAPADPSCPAPPSPVVLPKLSKPAHATFMADGRWRVECNDKIYFVDDSMIGGIGEAVPLMVATVNAAATGRRAAQVRGTDRPKPDGTTAASPDHND